MNGFYTGTQIFAMAIVLVGMMYRMQQAWRTGKLRARGTYVLRAKNPVFFWLVFAVGITTCCLVLGAIVFCLHELVTGKDF